MSTRKSLCSLLVVVGCGSDPSEPCDGNSTDLACGIAVAKTGGSDAPGCGLTPSAACASITYAIEQAAREGRRDVFVQAGTYDEVIVMATGIDVWGGYDLEWQRGAHTDPDHRVRVVGKLADGEYLTVRAHAITTRA